MSGMNILPSVNNNPAPLPKLDDIGNDLFTYDDIHDMFMSMVNAQIDHVLSGTPAPTSRFTEADQDELAKLVQEQMKRSIETRKRAVLQQKRSNVYTLLSRESLETYRQINSAVVTISALGAGFTFTVIFSDVSEPQAGISKEQVKTSLAVAWLLFVLAILLASFANAIQAMREGVVIHSLFTLRIFQGSLVLGAFAASAEAVRAYQPAVAITAFAVIGATAVISLFTSLRAKCLYRKVLVE